MNSINWPAAIVWVFIAQLVEHCSANAEATGSNPVEAPKNFFWATSQLLKLRFNCDGHIFISETDHKTRTRGIDKKTIRHSQDAGRHQFHLVVFFF